MPQRGGLLADLCAVATAFRVVVESTVLNVADGFRTIDARMVFREGITPEWEDEANAQGGHLQVQFKSSLDGGQLDEYWNNLVLGVIGGTIGPADVVTGVRLVNVHVGSWSNLQTRSGMSWKGISPAGIWWSRWQLSSYMLPRNTVVWRSSYSAGFGLSQEDLSQRDTSH